MSGKEPLNRNPVIASRRKCRLKYSSDGIFREGRDALEKNSVSGRRDLGISALEPFDER
ncbi:hypothetical protein [Neisseria blantyrii]|uniref:hypothetical protein n=1 Tax=Neisseria blantyrii TaxID=2830647 RepID=UPI00272A991C|nr:hypothetical protein [Neisseria blantyrii]